MLIDRFVIVDKGREVRIAVTSPPPIMPGVLIEERMVIVDGAEQILSGTIAPAPVMVTVVQKRIH